MPSYTFECPKCETRRTEILSLAEHEDALYVHCRKPMRQVLAAPQIVRDIEPYITVAADVDGKRKRIGCRREHQEFIRRNNLHEVGNEMPKPREQKLDRSVGTDVKRAIEQLKSQRTKPRKRARR